MVQHFEEEVKRKIVALHVEGRKIKSLVDEYKVSKASISNWVKNTAANARQTRI